MRIPVIENVLRANDETAAENRRRLREAGVATVDLMGSAGCGKTLLLERTLRALGDELAVGVVAGDIATTRDAERLARITPHVVQINTGGSCHLEARQVARGLDALDLRALDLLFVENVGNLICPASFDLGQDRKVVMISVPEGHDKPAKHPGMLLAADLLLLSKADLLPHVPFDREAFRADVASIRDDLEVLELSAHAGEGLEPWLTWLRDLRYGER